MDKKYFGELVRAARVAKGLSIRQLGKLMGSPQKVQNWEDGVNLPHPATLPKLIELLDLPANILQLAAARATESRVEREPAHPSLQEFLAEQAGDVTDDERLFLESQRFSGVQPDADWWARELLGYRSLKRRAATSPALTPAPGKYRQLKKKA